MLNQADRKQPVLQPQRWFHCYISRRCYLIQQALTQGTALGKETTLSYITWSVSAQVGMVDPYPLWLQSLSACAGREAVWRDAAEALPLEGSRYLGPRHRSWPQTSVPLKWCHPEAEAAAPLLPPGVQSGQLMRPKQAKAKGPSYPKLPLHQVGACDHLRDGMFHLQPRVHLHEVEVMLGIHDELHRTCTGTRTAANAVARRSLATFGAVCLGASHLPQHSWRPWLLSLLLLQVSSELQDQFQAKNNK